MTGDFLRCGLAGALLAAGVSPALADGLDAGLWRVTNKPVINGEAAPPAQNMKCLSAADVADLDRTFSPVSRTTNSTCEQVEHEITPQRLRWHLQCTGQIDMDVAGEFLFETPQRYTATITARSSMLGRLMQEIRTSIEAERVGDCQ